jgi:hypothetical protein
VDYKAYKKIENIGNSAYESADFSHCKPTAEAALLLISELCEVICEDKPLEQTRKMRVALFLREEGYSIRDIMKLLKYKSPKSVQDLLGKELRK